MAAALPLLTPQLASAQSSTASYVGDAECADCHEDAMAALARTQHGKAAFAKLSAHGCETCHGPGSEHVARPNRKDTQPSVANLDAQALAKMCQGCHDGGQQMFWMGSAHQDRGLGCTDCHSVHSYQSAAGQLKQATVMDSCFACHKETRAEIRKTSHHPIREGAIGCNDCHNPHGTTTDSMIRAASVNDQCYECHAEKRGPFLWEHAPVRENCLNCHTAHGSNHAKLQKTAIPYTCQQCHSNTRHPGTLYDGGSLFAASGWEDANPSNRVFGRSCLNCHANIHGSNNPSAPYLGR